MVNGFSELLVHLSCDTCEFDYMLLAPMTDFVCMDAIPQILPCPLQLITSIIFCL